MPQAPQRLTYTVEEASKLLGIGRNSGYERARSGELPTIKMGRRLLVPCAALDRVLRGGNAPDEVRGTTIVGGHVPLPRPCNAAAGSLVSRPSRGARD
jgi:excisionase family DNA binding protein